MQDLPSNSNPTQGSCLYFGKVMHQRFFPVAYKFDYSVVSLKVDVDRIEQEAAAVKGLSWNGFNLFSLKTKDFGSRDGTDWRTWMESLLAQYGIQESPAKIELVCFPRFLGMIFNPLAMWYAYDATGRLIAIVAEVSNTFGEWHHYVLTAKGAPLSEKVQAKALKVFHVSPFIGMDCEYRFRLQTPEQTYQIGIYQQEAGKPMLVATQTGRAAKLTTKNLLKTSLIRPFNTLKVVALIHWWALKIWLKGGKFHKTPKTQMSYGHTEMTLC